MALDRQLSRDFWLHEFRGWQQANESDVAKLHTTVVRVLQPIRSHFGVPVRPTSWMWWSSGEPRTGAHAQGGTLDFTVDNGLTREAWEWGNQWLVPMGYIGRWIYEPAREQPRQGEHVHVAPVADQIAVQGAGAGSRVQALVETSEGVYTLARVGIPAAALALGAWFFFPCVPSLAGSMV